MNQPLKPQNSTAISNYYKLKSYIPELYSLVNSALKLEVETLQFD